MEITYPFGYAYNMHIYSGGYIPTLQIHACICGYKFKLRIYVNQKLKSYTTYNTIMFGQLENKLQHLISQEIKYFTQKRDE